MLFNGGIFLFFFLVLLKVFLIGVYWLSTVVHRASPPSWTARPTLPSSQVQSLHVITEQRAELPVCCTFCNLLSSGSVVSDSAIPWTAARQASLPSLSLRVCSNSSPSRGWCRPTISSSVAPFSSCPQSLPESGSCPMSLPSTSGGQSIVTWDHF